MSYGKALVRVTVGSFEYVVFEPLPNNGVFDIHKTADNKQWSFFGWFNDPQYLEQENLEYLIRRILGGRTGIGTSI